MAVGDYVVAALKRNRVGRLGQVTAFAVNDNEWDPLVPKSKDLRFGQMGRRIQVRWDLVCGPTDQNRIVSLPEGSRFAISELLPTIAEIKSLALKQLQAAMNDPDELGRTVGAFQIRTRLSRLHRSASAPS